MGGKDFTGAAAETPQPTLTHDTPVTGTLFAFDPPRPCQEPIEITKPRTAYSDRVGARQTITIYPEARPHSVLPPSRSSQDNGPSFSTPLTESLPSSVPAASHDPAGRLHAGNDQLFRDQMLPIFRQP